MEKLIRQQVAHGLAQQVLAASAASQDLQRQAVDVLDQRMIEKRQPAFDRVGHLRPVAEHVQDVADQVGLEEDVLRSGQRRQTGEFVAVHALGQGSDGIVTAGPFAETAEPGSSAELQPKRSARSNGVRVSAEKLQIAIILLVPLGVGHPELDAVVAKKSRKPVGGGRRGWAVLRSSSS